MSYFPQQWCSLLPDCQWALEASGDEVTLWNPTVSKSKRTFDKLLRIIIKYMSGPKSGLGKLLYSFSKRLEPDIDQKSGTVWLPILKTGLLYYETCNVYLYLTTKWVRVGENGEDFCTRNPKYCIRASAGLDFSCSSAWNTFLKMGNGRFLSHNQRNSWFPRDTATVAVICVQWGKQEKHHVFCYLCFQCVNTFTHLYLTSPCVYWLKHNYLENLWKSCVTEKLRCGIILITLQWQHRALIRICSRIWFCH